MYVCEVSVYVCVSLCMCGLCRYVGKYVPTYVRTYV